MYWYSVCMYRILTVYLTNLITGCGCNTYTFPDKPNSFYTSLVSGPCFKVSFKIERVDGETIDDNDGKIYFLFWVNERREYVLHTIALNFAHRPLFINKQNKDLIKIKLCLHNFPPVAL